MSRKKLENQGGPWCCSKTTSPAPCFTLHAGGSDPRFSEWWIAPRKLRALEVSMVKRPVQTTFESCVSLGFLFTRERLATQTCQSSGVAGVAGVSESGCRQDPVNEVFRKVRHRMVSGCGCGRGRGQKKAQPTTLWDTHTHNSRFAVGKDGGCCQIHE